MKSSEEIPSLNVEIVGHIDHGKTTLLRNITGKNISAHSEELKRGITIKLGYADAVIYKDGKNYNTLGNGTPERYVSFIDAPGHEMLMATMLSGAAIIDAAILVIAANEGIKPQTREHFMVLQAKNIKNIIVVQNKIDLVSKEKALENYKEIKNFLKGSFAENAPIIPVSAQQRVNIGNVLEELCKIEIPARDIKSEPVFLVARSFDINKPGAKISEIKGGVLGGILKKGEFDVGDKIEIKPGLSIKKANQLTYRTLTAKILSIRKGSEQLQKAYPGASISIETSLDPSLTKADSLAGCLVAKEGTLPDITSHLKISYKLFGEVLGASKDNASKTEPLKTKEILMLSVNTTITVGTVEKINAKSGGVELSLNIPIIALKNSNVGIARNFNGHWRLIGWGEVVE